jgi:hypothetical protein
MRKTTSLCRRGLPQEPSPWLVWGSSSTEIGSPVKQQLDLDESHYITLFKELTTAIDEGQTYKNNDVKNRLCEKVELSFFIRRRQ